MVVLVLAAACGKASEMAGRSMLRWIVTFRDGLFSKWQRLGYLLAAAWSVAEGGE